LTTLASCACNLAFECDVGDLIAPNLVCVCNLVCNHKFSSELVRYTQRTRARAKLHPYVLPFHFVTVLHTYGGLSRLNRVHKVGQNFGHTCAVGGRALDEATWRAAQICDVPKCVLVQNRIEKANVGGALAVDPNQEGSRRISLSAPPDRWLGCTAQTKLCTSVNDTRKGIALLRKRLPSI
jgi:hypothetical protein